MRTVALRMFVALLVSATAVDAGAAEKPTLRLDVEAPKSVFSSRTTAQPEVEADRVVADNLRAMGVLYAMLAYERAGLFAAGDRIVADFASKKIALDPAATKAVKRLAEEAGRASLVADRVDFPRFVADLVHGVFSSIVKESIDQMRAYDELLSSVVESVDRFANEDSAQTSAADSLHTHALVLSHAGYGVAHYAAAQSSRLAHELTHVVQQSSVQKAYGVEDPFELVAKLGGRSPRAVRRDIERGQLGAKLIVWLAQASLDDPAKARAAARDREVAAWVTRLRALVDHPPRALKPGAKVRPPNPQCFPPGAVKPIPCKSLEPIRKRSSAAAKPTRKP